MTAQIPDVYRFQNNDWQSLAVTGTGLFEPSQVGITPIWFSTGCHRGYYCTYDIDNGGLFLIQLVVGVDDKDSCPVICGQSPISDNSHHIAEYRKLRLPVSFDGGLLLGRDFIPDKYIHMGFQEPDAYREVCELRFTEGRLANHIDHSAMIAAVGDELERWASQASQDAEMPDWNEIDTWLAPRYRADHPLWAILRDYYDCQSADRIFSPPQKLLERWSRRDAEQRQKGQAERDRIAQAAAAEAERKERLARELFQRIASGGWTCTHCGQRGVADRDFRLSVGASSCVICRRCTWPQELPK